MLQAALRDGTWRRRSVFELFCRRLPAGRRYGVVAGAARFLDALTRFTFDDEVLAFLEERSVVENDTLAWLADYHFEGDIWGYPEGETFFPGSPLLVVEGSFAECVVLETLALSIYNHDCAIASAGARMVSASRGRPIIEMGSRRAHEEAAVAAARAAYVTGFESTSNLEAGRRHGVPTRGTSAHAFTLLHDTERSAFESQVSALGAATTLLVDTFDIRTGVATGIAVAGPTLGGVRIDSGDLADECRRVRSQLDELGATSTRIVVTGDLDEHAIAALGSAPADGYGVGTALVTGSGAPTAELVYKLVARGVTNDADARLLGVAKRSVGKPTVAGRKWAFRKHAPDGTAIEEIIRVGTDYDGDHERPMLSQFVRGGQLMPVAGLEDARRRHAQAMSELPPDGHRLSVGDPAIPTVFEEEQ
ncbi:MAG: nicotinate phosphoribosyltransferase [Actinomycetes bacterium]